MRIFLMISALFVGGCATQMPAEPPVEIDPTSTTPMSKAEASHYAAQLSAESGESKTCLRDDLIRKSKLDFFAVHIENHIKCGGYDNPRSEVISLMKDTTIRYCQGPPFPVARIPTCWDGSFYDIYDPCFVCPPEPEE